MIYKKEYLELVVKPRVMRAAKRQPKTLFELAAAMGLPPGTTSTLANWLHELEIPVEDVIDNDRVRRMLHTRRTRLR